ncbi:hypothetical protein CR513_07203, partial [Mucuna pruriens]
MAITRRHEMPQQPILFYEIFDVVATKTSDAKVVVDFLKSNIFCRFGMLKALISDQGSHFCNKAMSSLLHNCHNLSPLDKRASRSFQQGNQENTTKDDQSQPKGLELTP